MTGETDTPSNRWALPASAVVHTLIAVLIIFGVPKSMTQPQEEQAISVTIEPPTEEGEAAPPPSTPPPEARDETQPPPPPAAEQPAAAAPPVAVLDPVVKFGERDAGPRQALDGTSAKDDPEDLRPSPLAEERPATDEASGEDPAGEEPSTAATDTTGDTTDGAEAAETDAVGRPDGPPDQEAGDSVPQLIASAEAEQAAAAAAAAAEKAKADKEAAEKKKAEERKKAEPALREARKLYSRAENLDAAATLAMANVPRGVRAGRLCATELRLQLQYGPTPYFPELIPSYELDQGTVLHVRQGAFRAGGAWYNLSFECQIDPDATEVVSFAYRVGERLSREEAKRRRLPMP